MLFLFTTTSLSHYRVPQPLLINASFGIMIHVCTRAVVMVDMVCVCVCVCSPRRAERLFAYLIINYYIVILCIVFKH